MTETAKERIYREALDEINNLAIDVAMDFEETGIDSVDCGKIMDIANKAFFAETNQQPSTTDKLSVEKLQEHLLPYKKEMVQKIIDEKMQLVTADEFLKLHKESLTAIRENDNLQEQLNTAKKALAESEKMYQKQMDRFLNSEMNESARSHCESQLKLLFPAHKAYDALAAIGGDDE